MTTQPNEHQKVLLDFINVSISVFSQATKGNVDLTNIVEIGKSLDLETLEKARDWLINPHDWWVVSTALEPKCLMVEDRLMGARGIVRDYTHDEWKAAFYAPSKPYRWAGGDERVEVMP